MICWLFFRTVTPEDKSFALGIQFMLFRVLGKQKKLIMQNEHMSYSNRNMLQPKAGMRALS